MKTRPFFIKFIIGSLLYFLFCGSASASGKRDIEQEMAISLSLKYPVVLVHGIAIRDEFSILRQWDKLPEAARENGEEGSFVEKIEEAVLQPWGRIPEILRNHGVDVYFGNTDAWGIIEINAELLKATIDKILEETGKEKVNIIAHSKGGLDSRYLIWKHGYGDKIASLTTISTPHHGSVVADFVQNTKVLHTEVVRKGLADLGKFYNDLYPDAYRASYELTTWEMKEFNRIVTLDERVFFQSIYTVMEKASDDPIFSSSYMYMKGITGGNDGLVSESSASWGNRIIKLEGGISHQQIIDLDRRLRPDMKIPNIYLKIAKDLSERGF